MAVAIRNNEESPSIKRIREKIESGNYAFCKTADLIDNLEPVPLFHLLDYSPRTLSTVVLLPNRQNAGPYKVVSITDKGDKSLCYNHQKISSAAECIFDYQKAPPNELTIYQIIDRAEEVQRLKEIARGREIARQQESQGFCVIL